MAYTNITDGTLRDAEDVQQLVASFNGASGKGQPLDLIALDADRYYVAIKNLHSAGKGLQILAPDGTVLFQVNATGVLASAAGGAAAAITPAGSGPQLQLNYVASTELANAQALTAVTWTNLGPNHAFTVDDADSLVEISVNAGAVITSSAGSPVISSRLLIDSATVVLLGADLPLTNTYGNPFSGMGPAKRLSLAAGAHTVQVQVRSTLTAALTCAVATIPDAYSLRVQVTEFKA